MTCCFAAALALATAALAQDPAAQVLDEPAVDTPTAEAPAAEAPVAQSPEPMADEPTPPDEPVASDDVPPVEPEANADTADPAEDEPLDAGDVDEEDAMDADSPAAAGTDWNGLVERAPAFFALTHHAAVHLPIALWAFGAFFVVIGAVVPSWRTQIPLACLIGGALTAVAAVASGWWYAAYEYGEPWAWGDGFGDWSEQLVKHRWTGFALAVASIGLSLVALISQARQSRGMGVFWRLGLIALALAVAWEGHIGGELIHGEGFLEDGFQQWVNPEAE
ncbi:hypothetical protein [Botrimarina colliarenosi]|nr:hypothetical protein [Botrimarina colliarenosi]